mgnify:CR=1 FL=1
MNRKEFAGLLVKGTRDGKVSIGPDGKMQMAPELLETLGITEEDLANGTINKNVGPTANARLSEIRRRPISKEEYDALPTFEKKGVHQLVSVAYLFSVVVLAVLTYFVLTNEGLAEQPFFWKPVIGGIAFAIFALLTIKQANIGLSKKSQIAVGSVVFCSAGRYGGKKMHYYVSVSFEETQQYVERISCSFRTFHKISMGSMVYVDKKLAYFTGR